MGNHQILEVRKEQREKSIDASSLWIFVKIFDNQVCFVHIAVDNGVAQLKTIKILTHPYLVLNDLRSDAFVILRQAEQHFIELAGQTRKVRTYGISNKLGRFRINRRSFGLQIAFDKGWKVTFLEFCTLKQHPSVANSLHIRLFSPVNLAVFMAHHQDCRCHRLFQVLFQRLRILDILGLFDDNYLILGHHRIAPCSVSHLRSIDVRAE